VLCALFFSLFFPFFFLIFLQVFYRKKKRRRRRKIGFDTIAPLKLSPFPLSHFSIQFYDVET